MAFVEVTQLSLFILTVQFYCRHIKNGRYAKHEIAITYNIAYVL